MVWAHPLDLPMVNPTVESTDHVDKFHESSKFYATPHYLELHGYVSYVVLKFYLAPYETTFNSVNSMCHIQVTLQSR